MIAMKSRQSKAVLCDMVERSKAGCGEGVAEISMGKISSSIPNISMKIKAGLCVLSWGRWSEVAEISYMMKEESMRFK